MKQALPVISLLLLLGGCATPHAVISAGPASSAVPVATIKGDTAGQMDNFMGDEIRCQMQSIDGDTVGATYQLRLGEHTLIVTLGDPGKEYVGVVQLLIPAAKNYRVNARRREDAITVSLVDEGAAKIVATSTAPLSDHMKFYVFVVQK